MKNVDKLVQINHNTNWLYICKHSILMICESGSGKTNLLLNLIKHQRPDADKNYLYAKDAFKSKYQLLINGREKVGIEYEKNSKGIY